MGPHWGILADCEAMTGMPGECAAIWEKHGIEILMPASHAGGHSPAEILSLPDYQFPIASLWKEAERTDKVIETLESVRRRDPSLQGVSRMLVDCYERMGDLETLPCAPRTRRSVTRPFARTASFGCSCASEARPKKRSAILRKRRKNTRVGPTVVGRGRQSVTSSSLPGNPSFGCHKTSRKNGSVGCTGAMGSLPKRSAMTSRPHWLSSVAASRSRLTL